MGWRGYALPRLQRGRSALSASLVLGVLWGVWHIPSFLTRNSIHQDQSFLLFMFWISQMAIVKTWLYNNTGGSVLHTWLFHVAVNHPRRKRRGFHRTWRREVLRTAYPDQHFLVPDTRCTA